MTVASRSGVLVATAFGLGHLRPAPGTWGTLGATLVAAAWIHLAPEAMVWPGLWIGVVVAILAGLLTCGAAIRHFGVGDPKQVVIDEVAGAWLALAVLPPSQLLAQPVLCLALGFGLFRVFDIAKPWPLSWLEHLPGALGILADDLAAGLLAGMLTAAALH